MGRKSSVYHCVKKRKNKNSASLKKATEARMRNRMKRLEEDINFRRDTALGTSDAPGTSSVLGTSDEPDASGKSYSITEIELYPLDEKLEVAPGTSSENVELDLLDENVEDAPGTSSQNVIPRSDDKGLPLQIIGDIMIQHDNKQMEVDDGNLTTDHVQKPRQIIGVRLNKAPKTSAERGREFRARKALLKQQCKQQQEPDAIVGIATEDIRSAGPSENNQVPEPSEITTIEKRAKSAEATRRWREKKKGVSESSKKQAKTTAQRMREYRERTKLAKKILLKQQSDQDLDAIVSTSSSQVNQRAGPSTINSKSSELTRRGNSQSQQQIERSERTREYRERRNDNVNIKSNNPSGNNEEQSDLCDLTLKYDDITKHKKTHENFDRKFRKNPFGYSCTVCDRLWFKNDLKKASDNYEDLLKKITILAEDRICRPCLQRADRFVIAQRVVQAQEAEDLTRQEDAISDFYMPTPEQREQKDPPLDPLENSPEEPHAPNISQNQDSSSNGIEINVFCPKCNTEVPHTAQGIQEDQTKILVAKVYHYFEQEYEEFKTIYGDLDLTPLSKFRERTALATGVSELMVLAILQEEEKRNAEKRQEPPGERRRTRKRSRHIKSIREEDSSNDNVDDGGQPSYYLQPNIESEIETLVVKIEPPESYMEQTHYDPISTEVKAEPPDDDVNNTNETLAFTEPTGTKRNGRKKSRSDVTSTWQHSQGESSTAAASTSVRLTAELDESGLLEDTEVKMENVKIGGEGFS